MTEPREAHAALDAELRHVRQFSHLYGCRQPLDAEAARELCRRGMLTEREDRDGVMSYRVTDLGREALRGLRHG